MHKPDELAQCATLIGVNDARRQQIDAMKRRAAKADAMNADRPVTTAKDKPTAGAFSVLLQCAADVTLQPILWLRWGWLAAAKLIILAGVAGTGKSTLAFYFAAVVSRGGQWPDGSTCADSGNVLIWSGEDDPADTIVPRLMLAGADLKKVHFVRDVEKTDGSLVPFDPAHDIPLLNERIASIGGARLLIVDPVISAVSGDAHRANEVRRNLQPLVDLAAAHGCAVIGITHFSKGTQGSTPTERVIGSQAFAAIARIVLVTAKVEGAECGILARAKSNIAPDDGGFRYTLEPAEVAPGIVTNRIVWGERIEGSARELLGKVERLPDDSEQTEQDEAEALLRGLLTDGPIRARELKADADGAGFNWKTMQRAASCLGIEKRKIGMKEGWEWALPKKTVCEGDTKNPEQYLMSPSGKCVPFGTNSEEDTKNPNTDTVSPSGQFVPFGAGVGSRPVPDNGFDEGDTARELESSAHIRPQDDDHVKDSV
jgi:putative DNA primase/helicase